MQNVYDEAYGIVKKFCLRNPKLGVGQLTCAHVYNHLKDRDTILGDILPDVPALPTETRPPLPLDQNYAVEELDLLALFCTLVKIIYIKGNLELVVPLSKLVNPTREGRPMHTTTIRNEHAYFCCINQLMSFHELPKEKGLPMLYLSGDSHALVTAWQYINFKGQKHIIKPLLVTGLKCWHLRPDRKSVV